MDSTSPDDLLEIACEDLARNVSNRKNFQESYQNGRWWGGITKYCYGNDEFFQGD